jgi:probable F420-dependent oxidoreductase
MDLGRIGLWSPLQLFVQAGEHLPEAMGELDASGFGTVWLGNGPTIMDVAAAILDATERITVATGIANIWIHPAATLAARHREIAGRHPERLLLGLGNGPRDAGQRASSPYRRMVAYFDELDALGIPAGSRVLAANGPRMLALAAERSLGAHPFLVTAEHTHFARAALGDGPLLAPELKVVLDADPVTARATARQALDFYLTKQGYPATLRRLGFTDEDLSGGGSDRLVDAVVAWGDVETVLKRVDEHHQAGADHVALQVLTPDPGRLPLAEYRELAAALR